MVRRGKFIPFPLVFALGLIKRTRLECKHCSPISISELLSLTPPTSPNKKTLSSYVVPHVGTAKVQSGLSSVYYFKRKISQVNFSLIQHQRFLSTGVSDFFLSIALAFCLYFCLKLLDNFPRLPFAWNHVTRSYSASNAWIFTGHVVW